MYELKIISQFAAAHCLREFKGKCEHLHGHNWKVEVYLQALNLDRTGLVKDFGEIKEITGEVLNGLDHKYLNDLPPFQQENPSSENIARYLFRELSRRLNDARIRTSKVSVWESDTSCASYME
jgi:6-pyruvoyltetrahydropterin/6-carboxytetrahydropterin synthase